MIRSWGNRPSRRALCILLAASAAAICGITVTVSVSASVNETNGCSANVQNPHYSKSHGGVDVTATWSCTTAPVSIDLLNPGGLALWNCPGGEPSKSLSYLEDNCNIVGTNTESPIDLPTARKSAFRTSPPLSKPAAQGHGWFIGSAVWQSHGPNGTGPQITDIGNPSQPNGPRPAHHRK